MIAAPTSSTILEDVVVSDASSGTETTARTSKFVASKRLRSEGVTVRISVMEATASWRPVATTLVIDAASTSPKSTTIPNPATIAAVAVGAGDIVGANDGRDEGSGDGSTVGSDVDGTGDGPIDGPTDGTGVGLGDGAFDGAPVGQLEGSDVVGRKLGTAVVGLSEGNNVGIGVGCDVGP